MVAHTRTMQSSELGRSIQKQPFSSTSLTSPSPLPSLLPLFTHLMLQFLQLLPSYFPSTNLKPSEFSNFPSTFPTLPRPPLFCSFLLPTPNTPPLLLHSLRHFIPSDISLPTFPPPSALASSTSSSHSSPISHVPCSALPFTLSPLLQPLSLHPSFYRSPLTYNPLL